MLDVMGQSNNGPDPLRVPVQSVTNFTIAEILRPEFGSRAETQKKTNSPSICLSQGIVRPIPYPRPCGLPFARKAIKSETLAFEAPTSPPRNRRKRIEGVFSSVSACNRCHGGEGSVLTSNRTKSEEDVSVSQAHTGPRCESHGLRQSSGTERPLSADNVLCRTRTDRSSALDDRLPVSKDDVSSPDSPAKEAPGKDRKAPVWPAWVYCTRYSDRPSSGPRSRKVNRKPKPPEEKRPRTAFTSDQLEVLQREFSTCRYLTETRRHNLATELQLNESQIKIWFQNKRAKLKKSSGDHGPLARVLLAQGLYNHSASPSTTGPAEDSGEQ